MGSKDFSFTFTRWTEKGPEERTDTATAKNLDEAVEWAMSMCELNECKLSQMEWFDEETKLWKKSVVGYT